MFLDELRDIRFWLRSCKVSKNFHLIKELVKARRHANAKLTHAYHKHRKKTDTAHRSVSTKLSSLKPSSKQAAREKDHVERFDGGN